LPLAAAVVAVGGSALAVLVWRSQGAALNRCLGLAALLQLIGSGCAIAGLVR
jgi:hypothetical protein